MASYPRIELDSIISEFYNISKEITANAGDFSSFQGTKIDLSSFDGWTGKTKDFFSNTINELNAKIDSMKSAYQSIGNKISKIQNINIEIEDLKKIIASYNNLVSIYEKTSSLERAIMQK